MLGAFPSWIRKAAARAAVPQRLAVRGSEAPKVAGEVQKLDSEIGAGQANAKAPRPQLGAALNAVLTVAFPLPDLCLSHIPLAALSLMATWGHRHVGFSFHSTAQPSNVLVQRFRTDPSILGEKGSRLLDECLKM